MTRDGGRNDGVSRRQGWRSEGEAGMQHREPQPPARGLLPSTNNRGKSAINQRPNQQVVDQHAFRRKDQPLPLPHRPHRRTAWSVAARPWPPPYQPLNTGWAACAAGCLGDLQIEPLQSNLFCRPSSNIKTGPAPEKIRTRSK